MYPKLHKPIDKLQTALINKQFRLIREIGGLIHDYRLATNPNYPMENLLENHLYAVQHPDHDPEYIAWWEEASKNLDFEEEECGF